MAVFEELNTKIKNLTTNEFSNLVLKMRYIFKIEGSEDLSNTSKAIDEIIEILIKKTVEECCNIVEVLENDWGVKAKSSISSGSDNGGEETKAAAEKSHYGVSIKNFKQDPSKKVEFIKVLRSVAPAVGISEAMKIFDVIVKGESFTLFDNLAKEECATVQKALESYCEVILK